MTSAELWLVCSRASGTHSLLGWQSNELDKFWPSRTGLFIHLEKEVRSRWCLLPLLDFRILGNDKRFRIQR